MSSPNVPSPPPSDPFAPNPPPVPGILITKVRFPNRFLKRERKRDENNRNVLLREDHHLSSPLADFLRSLFLFFFVFFFRARLMVRGFEVMKPTSDADCYHIIIVVIIFARLSSCYTSISLKISLWNWTTTEQRRWLSLLLSDNNNT